MPPGDSDHLVLHCDRSGHLEESSPTCQMLAHVSVRLLCGDPQQLDSSIHILVIDSGTLPLETATRVTESSSSNAVGLWRGEGWAPLFATVGAVALVAPSRVPMQPAAPPLQHQNPSVHHTHPSPTTARDEHRTCALCSDS